MLATVCSIFGLYIMGLVLCRRADKIDELKVKKCLISSIIHYKVEILLAQWIKIKQEQNFS